MIPTSMRSRLRGSSPRRHVARGTATSTSTCGSCTHSSPSAGSGSPTRASWWAVRSAAPGSSGRAGGTWRPLGREGALRHLGGRDPACPAHAGARAAGVPVRLGCRVAGPDGHLPAVALPRGGDHRPVGRPARQAGSATSTRPQATADFAQRNAWIGRHLGGRTIRSSTTSSRASRTRCTPNWPTSSGGRRYRVRHRLQREPHGAGSAFSLHTRWLKGDGGGAEVAG